MFDDDEYFEMSISESMRLIVWSVIITLGVMGFVLSVI